MEFDFDFTQEKLAACLPRNKDPEGWFNIMYETLQKYDISTRERVAAFIAQAGHESAEFTILKENLNYTAESLHRVWPSRFPTLEAAQPYHKNPEKIANKVYSARMGNGDEHSGDGWKFRGRGAIQLTGHDNYKAFAASVGMSIDEAVAYCETNQGALESACWFWQKNNLNQFADTADMTTLTKRINGGTLGLEDRTKHYKHAMEVL
jgi:putative chitinase